MKTTIDIADPLLKRARETAAQRGMTLRALVEQGLRQAMAEKPPKPFKLKDARYGGKGLTPKFADAPGAEILEASYGNRAVDRDR